MPVSRTANPPALGSNGLDIGRRLRFPSGRWAMFLRWRARAVRMDDGSRPLERVACVRWLDDHTDSEFSAAFIEGVLSCQK